jgi:hypothetical protein
MGSDLFCVLGHAMAQEINCQPLTSEAWVCTQVSPCQICAVLRTHISVGPLEVAVQRHSLIPLT